MADQIYQVRNYYKTHFGIARSRGNIKWRDGTKYTLNKEQYPRAKDLFRALKASDNEYSSDNIAFEFEHGQEVFEYCCKPLHFIPKHVYGRAGYAVELVGETDENGTRSFISLDVIDNAELGNHELAAAIKRAENELFKPEPALPADDEVREDEDKEGEEKVSCPTMQPETELVGDSDFEVNREPNKRHRLTPSAHNVEHNLNKKLKIVDELPISTQWEIPPSRDQNMDMEGLTSPVIRLVGEIQTPSPYRNHEAEACIASAVTNNNLVHLPVTSREQSPKTNTAIANYDNSRTSKFDNTLFSTSTIQPPPQPSSASPVLIPPRPSSAPPAIGTMRPFFTTSVTNHGHTIPTASQNNNFQQHSLGATQQQATTHENLPRVERGTNMTIAVSLRSDSAVQQQQQAPQAEPTVRPQPAPTNPPQSPVAEVQIPAHHAERRGNQENPAQESGEELEEVPIGDEEEEAPAMQESQAAPIEEQNNEPVEAQAQERNNKAEVAQESDAESNGNLSYVDSLSSIENFVFEFGWGSENDSDDGIDPGVVEPHEVARLRMQELQEQERQQRLREQHQQQQQQHQQN